MFERFRRRRETARMIRAAVDTCPDGICFGTGRGQPVLVNQQMDALVRRLLGRGILNTEDMWQQLQQKAIAEEYLPEKLREKEGMLFLREKEETIWQLAKTEVLTTSGNYVQYIASDITQLYRLQQELSGQVRTLQKQQERQRLLLQEIVDGNRNRELLDAKIKVHDDFGQCLIASRQFLEEEGRDLDRETLLQRWKYCIDRLLLSEADEPQGASPETELRRAAEMIGCRIRIEGERPHDHETQLLLYAAIREALTNAVRHGRADCLEVRIRRWEKDYQVSITDNGCRGPVVIREGNGLGNLRRRLEEAGALMEIRSEDGVQLILYLPGGNKP